MNLCLVWCCLHAGSLPCAQDMSLCIIECRRADLDNLSPAGDTPLHVSVRVRNTPVVKALVAGDANLDIRDRGGCTALVRSVMAACHARDGAEEERAVIIIRGA